MRRQIRRIQSQPLEREMPLCCWGHYGRPVLLFPTAGGDFLEVERFLLIQALEPLIEAGRIKVYSTDAIADEGWLNAASAPWQKSALQARYDAFIVDELCAAVAEDCGPGHRLLAAGASLGAYNAVNSACKHPDRFDGAVAMSGTYDFDRWMGGYRDENYYFNMPLLFLPNLPEGEQLALLRQRFFLLATGTGRYEAPWETDWVAGVLAQKGIPHRVEKWGADAHHDWPTWRTMLPLFLDRLS